MFQVERSISITSICCSKYRFNLAVASLANHNLNSYSFIIIIAHLHIYLLSWVCNFMNLFHSFNPSDALLLSSFFLFVHLLISQLCKCGSCPLLQSIIITALMSQNRCFQFGLRNLPLLLVIFLQHFTEGPYNSTSVLRANNSICVRGCFYLIMRQSCWRFNTGLFPVINRTNIESIPAPATVSSDRYWLK